MPFGGGYDRAALGAKDWAPSSSIISIVDALDDKVLEEGLTPAILGLDDGRGLYLRSDHLSRDPMRVPRPTNYISWPKQSKRYFSTAHIARSCLNA